MLENSSNKSNQTGNGSNDTFPYSFLVLDEAHLLVYLDDVVQLSGYTVTGVGDTAGGDVVFDTPPTNGQKVTLLRQIPLVQLTNYKPYTKFPAETVELALDSLTMMAQQVEERIVRSMKVKVSSSVTEPLLDEPVADAVIKWKTDLSGLENGPTTTDIINAEANATAAAASAVQADLERQYAAEWATKAEDSLISAAAGGDQVDDYSALHFSKKADAAKTAAETAKTAAETARTGAETAETNAETAETGAQAAQTAAELALDTFDDIFLGAKASDPTLDNDNNALQDGALYWNTTSKRLKVYDLGTTTWKDPVTEANTAKTAAETARTGAETAETNAETAETGANTAKTAAQAAQTAAEAAYDSFDDRYLGVKTSDPTLDNDGNALQNGALYWNSVSSVMKVYDTSGSAWVVLQNKSRICECVIFAPTVSVETGDGKFYVHIPAELDGKNLISVHALVITAGTTGTLDIQIHNVDNALDMLSTKLTIDSGETGSDTAATPAVINTSNDHVNTNDRVRIDIDAKPTTAPKGLVVTLEFN